jgi:hypothetical protein
MRSLVYGCLRVPAAAAQRAELPAATSRRKVLRCRLKAAAMHFSGSSRPKISLRGKSKVEESREQVLERTKHERERRRRAKQEETNAIIIQVSTCAARAARAGHAGVAAAAPESHGTPRPRSDPPVARAVALEGVVRPAEAPAEPATAVDQQQRGEQHRLRGPVSCCSPHGVFDLDGLIDAGPTASLIRAIGQPAAARPQVAVSSPCPPSGVSCCPARRCCAPSCSSRT